MGFARKGNLKKSWMLAVLLTLAGCAPYTTLNIETYPVGGYVTESKTGVVLGIAPLQSYYAHESIQRSRGADGCYVVEGLTVTWVSGAKQTISPITLCGSIWDTYTLKFHRPSDTEGLEQDLQFAIQVQTLISQQQQAEAAQNANLLEIYNNSFNKQKVNCTSIKNGETVFTSCE